MGKEGTDIAWTQWAYCGGTLVVGLLIGTLVVAPQWEKVKAKKQIPKMGTTLKSTTKSKI